MSIIYPALIALTCASLLSSCIMAPALGEADGLPPIESTRGTHTELALRKRIVWREGATVFVTRVGDVRLVKVHSNGPIEFSRSEESWSTPEDIINFGNNVLFVVQHRNAPAQSVTGYFVDRGRPIM
jgi:hypothetical protein